MDTVALVIIGPLVCFGLFSVAYLGAFIAGKLIPEGRVKRILFYRL